MNGLGWTLILVLAGGPALRASNPAHGAKAAGLGTAFAAVADDPSAVAYNPAGLAFQSGSQVYGGLTGLQLISRYEPSGGGGVDTLPHTFAIPNLYAAWAGDRLALGLGLFAPQGIGGREWPADGPTRYASVQSLTATVCLNPSVAWRPVPDLALGLGLDLVSAKGVAVRQVDQSGLGAGDASTRFEGAGWGLGFNLGLLGRPAPEWRLALAYRSRVDLTQRGTLALAGIAPAIQPAFGGAAYRTSASLRLRLPDVLTAGAAWLPAAGWTLSVEAERTDWTAFSTTRLDLAQEVPAAGLTDTLMDLGWRHQWFWKAGVERAWPQGFRFRAGYVYAVTPVPGHTLAPDNPDADQHNLALGVGRTRGRLVVDAYMNWGWNLRRSVVNPILSGAYRTRVVSAGMNAGWRF